MNEQRKLTMEQANMLADNLIALEPRVRDSNFAKVAAVLHELYVTEVDRPMGWGPSPVCTNQFRDLAGFIKD